MKSVSEEDVALPALMKEIEVTTNMYAVNALSNLGEFSQLRSVTVETHPRPEATAGVPPDSLSLFQHQLRHLQRPPLVFRFYSDFRRPVLYQHKHLRT